MKIIISPAKRMHTQIDFMEAETKPIFYKQAQQIRRYMKTLSIKDLQRMLSCNEQIAKESYHAYQRMNFKQAGVPALLSFDGIQYTYMKPDIFSDAAFDYAKKHVYILSGLYGILRAFDGVVTYRLEMDNPFYTDFCNSLYAFWGKKPYQVMIKEDHHILDLASKQYGKIIKKYATNKDHIVSCYFMEEENDRFLEKGVYVKMARGAMVRYLCEHQISDFEGVKGFCDLGYQYHEKKSNANAFVFTRKNANKNRIR